LTACCRPPREHGGRAPGSIALSLQKYSNRGVDSLSESGIHRMCDRAEPTSVYVCVVASHVGGVSYVLGRAKRQCDRTLGHGRALHRQGLRPRARSSGCNSWQGGGGTENLLKVQS
jgi:hypothetical protein